jgi:FkbM family methyltransferase
MTTRNSGPVRRHPPWYFSLAAFLIRHRLRGGYRIMSMARDRGLLDRPVRYRVGNGCTLDVPISRPETSWTRRDVLDYDPLLIDDLVAAVRRAPHPVLLVDCGADIGLVSVLTAARCPELDGVIAIEPNPSAFPVLAVNAARLPLPAVAHRAAVADVSGSGRLVSAPGDDSDHAAYVVQAEEGDFPLVRIDDLGIAPGGTVVIKLDVEGNELVALRGAVNTLRSASHVVISYEAHPAVSLRTGVEPTDIIRFLESIRRFVTSVSDVPGLAVTTDRPFFEQIRDVRQMGYNVLCESVEG